MAWIFLIAGAFLDLIGISILKYWTTTNKPAFLIPLILIIPLNLYLMSVSMKTIPMGTAYAVWVGVAVLGSAVVGIVAFNDSIQPLRIFFIILLAISIIGLKFTTGK